MKAFVKSNTNNPGLDEMDDMVGRVCELTGEVEDDHYVVREPNSHRTWWFYVDDLVLEDSPDFEDWVSGNLKVAAKKSKTAREIDKESEVVITRSTLQAIQSLIKEELRSLEGFTRIAKQDAKYFASIGDKNRSQAYYKLHDKQRTRLLKLQKHMKAVKKALT